MARRLSEDEIQNLSKVLRDATTVRPAAYTDNPLIGKGEGNKRAGKGIVHDLFNIMDQGGSAVRTSILNATDDDTKTGIAEGFVRGITGKQHTSTADILSQNFGVKNKLVLGLGGLAGDIASDPLTYVGGKIGGAKALTAGEAEIQASRTIADHVANGLVEPHLAPHAIADEAQRLMGENPAKFAFEVGVPGRRKTVAEFGQPAVVQKLKDIVTGPEGRARPMVQRFSVEAEKPYGFAEMSRDIESAHTGVMETRQRAFNRLQNEISPESNREAALAYENEAELARVGKNPLTTKKYLFGQPKFVEQAGLNTVGDYVNFIRNDRMNQKIAEFEAGLRQDELPKRQIAHADGSKSTVKTQWADMTNQEKVDTLQNSPDLLPKRVNNPKALELVPGGVRLPGRGGATYRSPHSMTFDELAMTKADPIAHLGDSHLMGMANSFRNRSEAAIVKKALDEMTLNASTPEGALMMQTLRDNPSTNIDWTPVWRETAQDAVQHEIARMPQYADAYIPHPIARMLNQQRKVLSDPDLGNLLMQNVNQAMSHWKAFNTVLSPGYFFRTSMGDIMNNMADEVYDPRRYYQSYQVMHDVRKNDVIDLAQTIRNPDEGLLAVPNTPDRGSTAAIKIGGRAVPTNEVYNNFHTHGGASGEIVTERTPGALTATDMSGDAASRLKVSNLRSFRDKITQGVENVEARASDANIYRETTQRMAHFIDRADKEITRMLKDKAKELRMGSTNLEAVRSRLGADAVAEIEQKGFKTAAQRVRKFNIDYGALTSFEKKYMRKVMPFYTFFRKNAPLQTQMMLTNPGFMMLYPKSVEAMQNLLGTNDGSGDWQVPDWIRESMPVRLATAGNEGNFINKLARFAAGSTDNNAVFTPLMQGIAPIQDIQTVLSPFQRAAETGSAWQGMQEAGRTVTNMTAPYIRMPFEAATGQSMYSGSPINDWKGWLAGGVGGGLGRVTYTASGFGDKAVVPTVTSWGVGPQFRDVGQTQQKSEFRRRNDLTKQHIDSLRADIAKKKNISPDSKLYKKIRSPEIIRLQNYMKRVGRSVGSYGNE